jgi:type III secretion protein D
MAEARLLRILSGPHLGAEMSLRPGRYAIGTDENCDIVLSDRRLAPRHASLILGEVVSIEPDEGAVTVGGTRIEGRVVVADFTPILLGTTTVALGPADADWPEIEPAKPAPEAAPGGDQAETAPAGAAALPVEAAAREPAPAAPASAAPPDRRRLRRRLRRAGLAMAVLALLVAAGLGLRSVDPGRDQAPPAPSAPASLKQVQKIVAELDFGSALQVSEVSGSSGKHVTVQGYLDTEEQRRELLAALQPLQGSLDVRVWSTALMDQSVRQVLAGMRLQLDVSETKEGKVVLAGVLPPSVSEDQLRDALQRDVPGITSLDLKVVSLSAATNWLRDQIAGIGAPERTLSITPNGHTFVVDGQLDSSLEGKWRDVVKGFGERYGSQIALRDDVTFGSDSPTFDFNIRAINLGPPAYITVDDAKYLVGSRLENGMILEEIMANGMVLRDGETRHLVEIARESGQITNVRELEGE